MKILAIGDITSPGGVEHLRKNLWAVRKENNIDFCIANGENASFISGISKDGAELLLMSGVDVITGGNHTMQNHMAHTMLDENSAVVRPINYGDKAPGRGYTIIDIGSARVLVINALGCVHMEPTLDMPYSFIDRVLKYNQDKYDIAILDIHAEATGEKLTVAHTYDGRINVIFGTHTHVPTADDCILPRGSAYVSDLGMCGESGGILGMDIGTVLFKMRTHLPGKFKASTGECYADGVIFTLDDGGRAVDTKRIRF